MQVKFHIPTLQNSQSAQELKDIIHASEADAKVNVDLQTKTVIVESAASAETFNELIVAAGHSIDKIQ